MTEYEKNKLTKILKGIFGDGPEECYTQSLKELATVIGPRRLKGILPWPSDLDNDE